MPFIKVVPPLPAAELVDALKAFGVIVRLDPAAPESEQALGLSYGLLGAVERNAMRAETVARASGTTVTEIGEAAAQTFEGARCANAADDLELLAWEAMRNCQRIQVHAAQQPRGGDELIKTIMMTAAALAGLLDVAHIMQNPLRENGETAQAATLLPKAITALEEAAKRAGGQRFVADLLSLTD